MNELSKFLVESIMEDENPIKKTVVIYVVGFNHFIKDIMVHTKTPCQKVR